MEFNLKNKKPDIRYLHEMISVLYDQKWAKQADLNQPLYYMYRGIKRKDDLRYDVTVIPPFLLGKEFVKTKGHYHQGNYQEVYQVLSGKAIYLFQKEKDGYLKDVIVIHARAGDIVIIPVQYGHITINPSKTKTLMMANWVSEKCQNNYKLMEKTGGGGYFYTQNGWVKNKNYKEVPEIHFKEPQENMPSNLNFLKIG
ncbi:MAG TPA: glucose-6-phosphate isomerase [Candidatus Portnoybacteria bacterium]|nr:glucose-6-phosphate isomerase [Candidatus Portnoybacteria bacterium]